MIEIMQANWLTVLIISFTFLITPFYWFLVLPFKKAILIAVITSIIGSLIFTLTLFNIIKVLSPFGGLLIVSMWIIIPALVYLNKHWFVTTNQKAVVGVQVFRLIGALFIVEMFRDHIPASFALPAGIGDIIVGSLAVFLLLRYKEIPKLGLIALIAIGILDLLSAFFFGFTSQPGPLQLFALDFNNQVNLFPTGLIPIFLAPYAITYHVLSLINIKD